VIDETARQLGRMLGQGEEYRALQRAREALEGDAEIATKLRRLEELAAKLQERVAQGLEPEGPDADEYDRLFNEVQTSLSYQRLVSAQSNFDKMMHQVQERIVEGMQQGAESRIITLT
jgi:cell fate (sporulation/competence/biofilm development) regulator YlbF (YheA/YmcA/DUF963 family)